jgi:hypothetical protein
MAALKQNVNDYIPIYIVVSIWLIEKGFFVRSKMVSKCPFTFLIDSDASYIYLFSCDVNTLIGRSLNDNVFVLCQISSFKVRLLIDESRIDIISS